MTVIREAKPADAPAIAHVHVEAWRNAYAGQLPDAVLVGMSRETHTTKWARVLGRQRHRDIVLVAETDEAGIIGFGSCGRARHGTLPHRGEVYTLYVHPDYQNQGVGRALLDGLFGALATRHVDSAVIWVLAANPSRFFYEVMGGRRVGERTEHLWGTTLDEVAYGWMNLAHRRAESGA